MSAFVPVAVRLPAEVLRSLDARARAVGLPRATLIRVAVMAWLREDRPLVAEREGGSEEVRHA